MTHQTLPCAVPECSSTDTTLLLVWYGSPIYICRGHEPFWRTEGEVAVSNQFMFRGKKVALKVELLG